MRFLLLALFLVLLPDAAQAARSGLTVEDQYELGMKYLRRGYYEKALEQFNRIRNYHRDSPYAVKAELAIADVYFKKGEWDQARVAYEDFLRMHPRYEDLDYVVYRLGLTAWKKAPRIADRDQTWTRHAVDTWSNFGRFEGSDDLPEVQELREKGRQRLARKELRIARFYARQRASWVSVPPRLEDMLARYPESPDAPEARAWLAIALWEQGQRDVAIELASAVLRSGPETRVVRLLARRAPELVAAASDAPPPPPAE